MKIVTLPLALLFSLLVSLKVTTAHAEQATPPAAGSESASRRTYVGTSMFMLANLVPQDYPPVFFQLNAGYRITPRDTVSVEAMTWRYYAPLRIPWGKSYGTAAEAYPGQVREVGVGLAYQRYLWNGAYTSLSAVPFWRQYHDEDGDRIGHGFQLFLTARLGYHFRIMGRVFIEPSIAFTAWPVSTHVPEAFAALDRKWPSYFLFEPGLHTGVWF